MASSFGLGGVSIVELCQSCKETDNKRTDARWKCTDCDKLVCDDCKKKHDVFIKSHVMTRIIIDTRAPCLNDIETTETTWYCADCNICMCNTCNTYHGEFLKNHNVTAVNIDTDVKHWTSSRRDEAVGKSYKKLQKPEFPSAVKVDEKKGSTEKYVKRVKQKDPTSFQNLTHLKTTNESTQLPKNKEKPLQVSERSLKLLRKKRVAAPGDRRGPDIMGSVFLSDGSFLLTDRINLSLQLFSADLLFTDQMKFSTEPWDVAVYDTKEIAVSFAEGTLVRVRVDRGMKLKEICSVCTSHECCGIAYITRDQLAVATGGDLALVIMTVDGKELRRISTDTRDRQLFTEPWYVAVDVETSRVYVSDADNNSVTAINPTSHEVVYVYKHKLLEKPCGLTVNKDGCVYVCGFFSHNVHRITPSGVNAGIFPASYGPKTISFNPNTNDAIVAVYSSKLVFV